MMMKISKKIGEDDIWRGKLKILMRDSHIAQAYIPKFKVTLDIHMDKEGTIMITVWKKGRLYLQTTRFAPRRVRKVDSK